jgi:hypothetical protein
VPIKDAGPDRSKKAPILTVSSAATLLPKKISINTTAIVAVDSSSFILSSFSIVSVVAFRRTDTVRRVSVHKWQPVVQDKAAALVKPQA